MSRPEHTAMSDDPTRTDAIDTQREMLSSAIDSLTGYALVTLNPFGVINSWSVGAKTLFGHSRDDAIGRHVSILFPEDTHQSADVNQALEQAQRHGSRSNRQHLQHRDGSLTYVSLTISTMQRGSACVGYAMLAQPISPAPSDISGASVRPFSLADDTPERLSASDALLTTAIAERAHAEAARLHLLRRLIVAEEEERRRLARDLHDDIGQRLTTLRLALEALEGIARDRTDLSNGLSGALAALAKIDQGLDFLAWGLRPAALDELGLMKVLENYVGEWSKQAGVQAVFHLGTRAAERFAPEVESTVYRIAQEALNNVAKHARAQSVNVLLEQRGDNVVLIIEDDGTGLHGRSLSVRMNGLTGMKERAAAVGGTLELEPTPEGGTTVLARIPIAMAAVAGIYQSPATDHEDVSLVDGPSLPAASGDTNPAVLSSIRARVQELHQAVVARDEFIATVAHELRNPVAPLMFQVRLAIDRSEQISATGEPLKTDWVQSQLRRIEHRLHRLLETLDRLLDVSRLSTGRIDLQPERVDLGQAVRDVLNTLESELAVARCTLQFSERRAVSGWWDRMRVEQICRNLLSNAIRFGAGRPITISVDADQDFATLVVGDHGVGIPHDLHARIFERFERGTERRSGGFGIGLWVVKNICVAMGGTITVESELGEGACFTVMLPCGEPGSVAGGSETT